MNFLLNSFQSKSNKFMVEPTVFIDLAETPLSHIRRLSHNRGLSSIYIYTFFLQKNNCLQQISDQLFNYDIRELFFYIN